MSRKLPKILNDEEIKKVLAYWNTRYFSQYRNKVLMRLILSTGLRISEVINLKWEHINLTSGEVNVTEGKGKKDRVLWVNNDIREALICHRGKEDMVLVDKVISPCVIKYIFTSFYNKKLSIKSKKKYQLYNWY